jgi:tripartite-type tricarboxylate transporter receptor subunit TctC
MFTRRQFSAGALATAGLASFAPAASAQSSAAVDGWPGRPVRVIIPSGAGGPAENFRIYAEHFREVFGQTFVHENQPGASGAIGSLTVARAAPDGYTLLCPANSHVILAPLVAAKPSFDVKKDFEPIGLLVTYPFNIIVNSELPVKTLRELVAYAKTHPGKLNFGSIVIGTGGHLVTELLRKRTGIDIVHVPFTGAPAQVMAVSSGALHFCVDTIGNSRGAVEAGKVRPLAVTGTRRAAAAPDLPTFLEEGFPGFELQLWLGLMAPKGTSPRVIAALNREIGRCNDRAAVRERLQQAAYEPGSGSPQDFAKLIDEELDRWSAIVRDTGVRIPG